MAALRRVICRAPYHESLGWVVPARNEVAVKSPTPYGSWKTGHALLCAEGTFPTPGVKAIPSLHSSLLLTHSFISVSPSQSRIAPAVAPSRNGGHLVNFDLPPIPSQTSLEMPTSKISLINTHIMPQVIKIEAPSAGPIIEKLAVRAIVRRRRAMRKHQLKKWRKKFRKKIDKIKAVRNIAKERMFLSGLLEKMVQAESFDPKAYITEKLEKAHGIEAPRKKLPPRLPWRFKPIVEDKKSSS